MDALPEWQGVFGTVEFQQIFVPPQYGEMEMNMKITRLVAAYIDNFFVTMLSVPVMYVFYLHRSIFTFILLASVYMFLLIIKDIPILHIGKRVFQYDVFDARTGTIATVKQRILRNLTLLIWPVEVIVLLLSSDGRRISDRLLKTEVKKIMSDS